MANDAREKQLNVLTDAISRVLTPVVICMLLAIWLVHSIGDRSCSPSVNTRVPGESPLPWRPGAIKEKERQPDGTRTPTFRGRDALIFVCVFCVLIVVFTYLIFFLYRRGYTRVIGIWVICAVAIIFAYVGGVYLFEFARSHCINVDWVSLTFAVWNFSVVGLVSIFWSVPRLINQTYLIVMSALMAFIFRSLPEWATWTILGVLVAWDLFAVLAPFGPLGLLVKEARVRQEPLPALVYDTNPNAVGRDKEAQPPVIFKKKRERTRRANPDDPDAVAAAEAEAAAEAAAAAAEEEKKERRARRRQRKRDAAAAAEAAAGASGGNAVDAVGENGGTGVENNGGEAGARARTEGTSGSEQTQGIGTLGTHLKLGLGDFVFYSILVAQASRGGAMTAITSFVAILAGLCVTLFLVVVYKKALPALPISIVFGMGFYFLTRFTVFPFVLNLMPELIFH